MTAVALVLSFIGGIWVWTDSTYSKNIALIFLWLVFGVLLLFFIFFFFGFQDIYEYLGGEDDKYLLDTLQKAPCAGAGPKAEVSAGGPVSMLDRIAA